MSDLLKRRLLWWALFGGGGGLLITIWFWGVIVLVILVVLMVIGGLGYHAQQTPPPLPTQAVYSSQWLNLVQHVDTANGFFAAYPAAIWIAAMQSASGGMPLDRTAAGGYGLYDLPHAAQMGHPLAATNAFALDLRQHTVPNNLQATLNAVGATLAPAQSDWSAAVRALLTQLEQGPEVAAWPITMDWSRQITNAASAGRFGGTSANSTVVWDYPAHTPIWVAATASAPVGNPYSVAWTPPYTACTPPPPHSSQKPTCHLVTDNLTGRDIEAPTAMTLTTSRGQVVPMIPMEGPNKDAGFVYNHAVLYVTAQKVLVNATHPATITAHWGSLAVSMTLPGSGFASNASGPVGYVPPPGNPQTLYQIWSSLKAVIRPASAATGTPDSLFVSEAYQESKGVDYPYAGSQTACGVWQMFSPGSFTQYAPPGTPDGDCADPAIEAQAAGAFLAALHQMFGSWRIALAAYYGGPGTVEHAGVSPGTSWAQAAPLLNWVPDPSKNNVETMTAYAESSYNNAMAFAQSQHLPLP